MNHLGTQTIETERLILRQYKMTDADDMFRNWVTDLEVSKFWGWEPHKDIEETKSSHTHHHVDNPSSGKVMQKTGFRYIDTKYREIPDCSRISGNYCYYEISKDDWLHAK